MDFAFFTTVICDWYKRSALMSRGKLRDENMRFLGGYGTTEKKSVLVPNRCELPWSAVILTCRAY